MMDLGMIGAVVVFVLGVVFGLGAPWIFRWVRWLVSRAWSWVWLRWVRWRRKPKGPPPPYHHNCRCAVVGVDMADGPDRSAIVVRDQAGKHHARVMEAPKRGRRDT